MKIGQKIAFVFLIMPPLENNSIQLRDMTQHYFAGE